ncbi:hypothetical protein PUR71_05910, partial [Streptomyces sp. SP17BM10]|nr:hypothetical protein [Streptomyces sp. SP17BM10]
MSDPIHDTLGDRLRLLGTRMPEPTLPAAEIRRRADRRRHRRRALGVTAACTAAALCLVLPSVLHSPGPQHGAATTVASPASASPSPSPSPRPSAAFGVTSTATAPVDAGAVAEILASCLGADASQYHPVIAVRTPVSSADTDGVVIAVNSAEQYVQCESKGHKGRSR